MAVNIANAYRGVQVNTASPAELTLMLYDGAIKFGNIALVGFEKNDLEKINTNLLKMQRVIQELRSTLDFKYPVANDFERIYEYINRRLIEGNMKKDVAIVEEALQYIREMRDTWKEVMTVTRTGR